jgi:hypothetical protein
MRAPHIVIEPSINRGYRGIQNSRSDPFLRRLPLARAHWQEQCLRGVAEHRLRCCHGLALAPEP